VVRTRTDELLLGEWACLALLTEGPAHGYDVATRLAPSGDIGRVWSLSRPLTYRAIDQLTQRGLITAVAEERGKAGGNRTIFSATPAGRRLVRRWLQQPVPHFRAVRDELLLKLVLCSLLGVDTATLLAAQRDVFAPMVDALAASGGARKSADDPVAVWRYESSRCALRFIDRMLAGQAG
jgi:DNA-binding PadR family transcriptional regulator